MDILVSIASIGMGEAHLGERTRSWRALSLACDHPATEEHTREEAQALISKCAGAEFSEDKDWASAFEPTISLKRILEGFGLRKRAQAEEGFSK